MHGTVLKVDGDDLVVRMSTGEIDNFVVPDSEKFVVDGKELSIHELQPGTKLTATVTTTTTPVTERTTTIGTGKVWYVAGNTVIVTLPNNENRMYKVTDDYSFIVNGQKAGVHDLRKGMTLSAEKIVESPKTEIDTNTTVTGTAPAPKPATVAAAPTPAPAPRPAPVRAHTPPPAAPAPTPAAEPAPTVAEAAPPARLPKTGSPLPLIGLIGLLFITVSIAVRLIRRLA
jgi:hypothetical protein